MRRVALAFALIFLVAPASVGHGSALREWIIEIGKTALTKDKVADGLRWLADSLNARPDARKDAHGGPVATQTDTGLKVTGNSALDEEDEKALVAAVSELVKEKGPHASSGVAVGHDFTVGGNFANYHVERGGTLIIGAPPPQAPASTGPGFPAPALPPDHSPAETVIEENDLLFKALTCDRSGREVRCNLNLTNQREQSMSNFELLIQSGRNASVSYLVDNFGNQHPITKMTLGATTSDSRSAELRQSLPPRVPINASVTAASVPSDATSVHLVVVYFNDRYHTLTMHNLPITSRR